jgi:hypothetical protein
VNLLNSHSKIYLTNQGCGAWVSFYLEMTGSLILLVCATLIIAFRGHMDVGLASVCLYNALAIPQQIYFLIMFLGEVENTMISVERADALTKIEGEAPRERHKDA